MLLDPLVVVSHDDEYGFVESNDNEGDADADVKIMMMEITVIVFI